MLNQAEKEFFLDQGYLHIPGVLEGEYLQHIQSEFDRAWEIHQLRVSQHQLLQHKSFVDMIEHAPILDRHKAIFGSQVQLLQYDLLRQGPHSTANERSWHRDFTFPGERPLAINTIVMLNNMTEERGPTRVVPGSHRGEELPPRDKLKQPLANELVPHLAPGDAIFINGAIWHTGGRNNTDGLRHGIYMYYGYWWLKTYQPDMQLPWQAFEHASEQRLRLLGVKTPGSDIDMYAPDPHQASG
jgi:hypothetical protein